MNKKEIIEKISQDKGYTKAEVKDIIESAIDCMIDELSVGNKIRLVGFGAFELRKRAKREGRNPQTGEKIVIPQSVSPAFMAGKVLKEKIKNNQK